MVHARGFSFYDDAVSVALPSPIPTARTLSGFSIPKPTADPSIHLFKLRKLQSAWYQTLYQGNPTESLPDITSFIWQKCSEMSEWSKELPLDMSIPIREMLDLELRYSYVYCIASAARGAEVSTYGKLLIFDQVIEYIDNMCSIASMAGNAAFYTYHDALRVFFMGSQFVAILRKDGDLLLSGSPIPAPHPGPGNVTPPLRPVGLERSSDDILDRSLRCLERIRLTLRLFGNRWEQALSLMDNFEIKSNEAWKDFSARRAGRDATTTGQWQQMPHA